MSHTYDEKNITRFIMTLEIYNILCDSVNFLPITIKNIIVEQYRNKYSTDMFIDMAF